MNDQEILAFALTCGITAIVLFAVVFRWGRQDRPKPDLDATVVLPAQTERSDRLDATITDLLTWDLRAVAATPGDDWTGPAPDAGPAREAIDRRWAAHTDTHPVIRVRETPPWAPTLRPGRLGPRVPAPLPRPVWPAWAEPPTSMLAEVC